MSGDWQKHSQHSHLHYQVARDFRRRPTPADSSLWLLRDCFIAHSGRRLQAQGRTVAQSHWKSQGHQPAPFFSGWFNPTHLAFHDPSNQATVRAARVNNVQQLRTGEEGFHALPCATAHAADMPRIAMFRSCGTAGNTGKAALYE